MDHFDPRLSTQLSVLNKQGVTELHCTFNVQAELGNYNAKTHAAKVGLCGAFVLDKRYHGVL